MAMNIVRKTNWLTKLTGVRHIVASPFVKQVKTIDTLTESVSMSPDLFFRQVQYYFNYFNYFYDKTHEPNS